MGVVQRENELDCEPPHRHVRNQTVFEPGTETSQRLSHEREHKTSVGAIWALVFKIVQEMADVSMAENLGISITEMPEDFSLKYRMVGGIALCT